MTIPHGLVGKGYRWLIVLIIAAPVIMATLALEVFIIAAPFWIIAIIGTVIVAAFLGFFAWLAFGSQSYDGGG